jgi:hypothetical protein
MKAGAAKSSDMTCPPSVRADAATGTASTHAYACAQEGDKTPSTEWIGLLDRLRLAAVDRHGLGPEDAATIWRAFHTALADDIDIETGLGLPARWRATWRTRQMRAAAIGLWLTTESQRGFACRVHRKLCIYRSTSYEVDAAGVARPHGERFYLFCILAANGGHVPSKTVLRGLLSSPR